MKLGILSKKDSDKKTTKEKAAKKEQQANWYIDRYQSVVLQRNFLFIFSLLALALITASILTIQNISSQQRIE
ncbi:type IV secretion system protein, partial [bacterium LRH843]|nr:type IV secretion system protein [bacterium LRH843]